MILRCRLCYDPDLDQTSRADVPMPERQLSSENNSKSCPFRRSHNSTWSMRHRNSFFWNRAAPTWKSGYQVTFHVDKVAMLIMRHALALNQYKRSAAFTTFAHQRVLEPT
jgi:hypothetical protein